MVDVKFHNENLCSIAGLENSFLGRFTMKEILSGLLRDTEILVAEGLRPYYDIELSKNSVSKIRSSIADYEVTNNWFSISFVYLVGSDNDYFLQSLINIWFEYEQPSFCFFSSKNAFEKYKSRIDHKNLPWSQITELCSCYVVFRAAEEDVMWIGKSKTKNFDDIACN